MIGGPKDQSKRGKNGMIQWTVLTAERLLKEHLANQNLIKHCWAVEGAMRAMAARLGGDADSWALAGLLHDLDYDKTKDDFPRHGTVTGEILRGLGFDDEEILRAILEHSGNVPPESTMGRALYCVDPATGFIVACALMHPSKKVAEVPVEFMMKRFAEKRFAQGANREQMRTAEGWFGIAVPDLLCLVRDGMATRSGEIGL